MTLAVFALVVAGVGVFAATQSGGGRIDRHTFRSTDTSISTSTTEWTPIRELRTFTGCPGDPSTAATLSLELAEGSAPVEVEIKMKDRRVSCVDCEDQGQAMEPGVIRFRDTGSFTFVTKKVPGEHGAVFNVQWRIAPGGSSGAQATLDAGTLHLLWDRLDERCR